MKIGYVRVSKADGSQVHDLQLDAMKVAKVTKKNIYTDTISGCERRPRRAAGPRCVP